MQIESYDLLPPVLGVLEKDGWEAVGGFKYRFVVSRGFVEFNVLNLNNNYNGRDMGSKVAPIETPAITSYYRSKQHFAVCHRLAAI